MGGLLGREGGQRVFLPLQNYWGGGGGGGKGYVPPPPPKLLGGTAPPPRPPLFLRLCVFRERLSVCVFASFPYGFESGYGI